MRWGCGSQGVFLLFSFKKVVIVIDSLDEPLYRILPEKGAPCHDLSSHAGLRDLLGPGRMSQCSQPFPDISERVLRRSIPRRHESCAVETHGLDLPYLDAIEHLWCRLEKLVYEVHPVIEHFWGPKDQCKS